MSTTIIPNQRIKHGKKTFEAGQNYEVSENDAEYFAVNGWLGDPEMYDGYAYNGEHSLRIHDVQIGHSAEVN